ncbi:hypothetical protein KCP69_10245 [Salmonella enterica subsp. enterica]|nr:hypothetical protein KCP69_10245 [Salmonella enterica subsp. enterica]
MTTNAPEVYSGAARNHLQRDLKGRIAMMNRLQQALEHDHFPDGAAIFRYSWGRLS